MKAFHILSLSLFCVLCNPVTVQAQSALTPVSQNQKAPFVSMPGFAPLPAAPFKQATGVTIPPKTQPENFRINCGCGPAKPEDQPLYVVDQQIVPSTIMRTLNPDTIQSIEVYKGEEAIKRYGSCSPLAKNGVIEITLKKPDVIAATTLK